MGNKNEIQKTNRNIQTLSKSDFSKNYSPKNVMKYSGKIKTLNDAIKTQSSSIAKFKSIYGSEFIEAWVTIWLLYINDMLNLRRPMTEDQIELCSVQIVDEYKLLKITDLALLTKRIINGEYGEFYESLSIAKVMTFFRDYTEERLNTCAENSLREHQNEKQNLNGYNVSKNVERWYKGKSELSK